MSGAPAEPSPAVMARDAAPSSGWLTGCCLPCVASPFLDAALLLAPVCCGLSSYLGMERTQAANHNDLALWSLQHPGRGAGCPWYCGFGCGLPIGAIFRWWSYLDGSMPLTVNVEYGLFARSNGRTPYLRREAWFGRAFGFTGKLTLADGDRINAMLEGAMDRGEYLGPHPLTNMPSFSDGSTSFPLALPSGHCPMNTGAHATFIAMFQRYFWNAEARARLAPDNEVARRAEAELATGFAAAVSLYERAPTKFAAGWSGRDLAFIDVYLTRLVFWGMLGVDIGAAGTPEYELAMWAQDKVNLGASYFTIYDMVPSRLVSLLGLNRDKLRRLHELVQGCDALRDFAPESSTDGWVDEREGRTAQMLVDDLNGASPRRVPPRRSCRAAGAGADHGSAAGAKDPRPHHRLEPLWRHPHRPPRQRGGGGRTRGSPPRVPTCAHGESGPSSGSATGFRCTWRRARAAPPRPSASSSTPSLRPPPSPSRRAPSA